MIVVLAALAGVLLAAAAVDAVELVLAGRRLRAARADRPGDRGQVAIALARLGRRAGVRLPAAPDLQRRLDAAGLSPTVRPADLRAVQAGGLLAGGGAGAVLAASGPPGLTSLLLLAAPPAAGLLLPAAAVRRRAAARRVELDRDVADVLDLLRVATSAGLPVGRALAEVGRHHPGLLARELRQVARQVEVGVPRAAALESLRRRCPLPAVEALVAAVLRAERHGAPLAVTLAGLAADARAERARRLQERAAQAGPKVQLVVALGLVPSVLLLLAAVMAGKLLGG